MAIHRSETNYHHQSASSSIATNSNRDYIYKSIVVVNSSNVFSRFLITNKICPLEFLLPLRSEARSSHSLLSTILGPTFMRIAGNGPERLIVETLTMVLLFLSRERCITS
ncbi:hypothetical protein Nepgr_018623 [Nepenthes gracilis]|uniref:Uncharacterized protein n=1 Tax=Nepenthes gracilis TaxID=150966 RepID=A0AAD3XT77_NEPGR|nr:hypothetical protein Nepgr_018623 [Nepenthes gracilis]